MNLIKWVKGFFSKKTGVSSAIEVVNKKRKHSANCSYFQIKFEYQGDESIALFTQTEITKGLERAGKNKEDIVDD